MLWEKRLSPRDRERLGDDLKIALKENGGTVGMFMKLRRVDRIEAIIRVAGLLGFVCDLDRDRLLREWGLPSNCPTNDQLPTWNPDTGNLYWGRHVIRHVRLFKKKPSNLQVLVEEFAAANWPEVIDSPFQFADTLYETLRALNKGLDRIQFHAASGGDRCRWEAVPTSRRI